MIADFPRYWNASCQESFTFFWFGIDDVYGGSYIEYWRMHVGYGLMMLSILFSFSYSLLTKIECFAFIYCVESVYLFSYSVGSLEDCKEDACS